jgi:putative endonuclease
VDNASENTILSFWTYIIQNEAGTYYVGHTDDLDQRLDFHNTGQSHYTARKGPWKLVYSEAFDSRSLAMKRESEIKRWKSRVRIEDLIKNGPGRASR